MMAQRSTVDIVVILLTSMVAVKIMLVALGTMIGKIMNPNLEVKTAAELIGGTITTVVGALIGFIGGRAHGRNEAVKVSKIILRESRFQR